MRICFRYGESVRNSGTLETRKETEIDISRDRDERIK